MATPAGPYTPIVRAGGWLAVSGQIGRVDVELVAGGVVAETEQCIRNIEQLLADEGAALTDIVKTTVFLRHMRDMPLVNEAYAAAFGEHRPARSAVAVVELPQHALVKVEAWAYVGAS